jgi:hypothetical protein
MTRPARVDPAVLWSGGLLAGTGVLAAVAALLHLTLRPAREIDRYATDIAESVGGLRQHLSLGDALSRLGAATGQVRDGLPADPVP